MHTEIELKLRVAAQDVSRVQRHRLLRELSRGPATTRQLHSVYYDTPERDLWRRGMALRLRRDGHGWVQTLKSGGGAAAGLHRRDELEAHVAGQQLDFTKLAEPEFADRFADPKLRAALAPAFITRFRRTTRMLETPDGARIELSLDRGEVIAGDRREPICELELELKAGNAARLFDIARRLIEDAGVKLEHLSKAERGFALIAGRAPVKAAPVPFAPDDGAGDAFAQIVSACLAHMQANERGLLEGKDPEYLHQMRVALRRLRSAFNLFAPLASIPHPLPFSRREKGGSNLLSPSGREVGSEGGKGPAGERRQAFSGRSLVEQLKWLSGKLGAARDWDVLMIDTLAPVAKEFRAHAGINAFMRQSMRLRRAADRAARAAVASLHYQQLLLAFGEWLAAPGPRPAPAAGTMQPALQPVLGFATAVLTLSHARVRKRGRRLDELSAGELHRLRIAIKKLRYAADFFAALYPRRQVRTYLARLAELQQVLGVLNDLATSAQLLRAVPARSSLLRESHGIIMGWSALSRARELQRLAHAWHSFRRAKAFW